MKEDESGKRKFGIDLNLTKEGRQKNEDGGEISMSSMLKNGLSTQRVESLT